MRVNLSLLIPLKCAEITFLGRLRGPVLIRSSSMIAAASPTPSRGLPQCEKRPPPIGA